MARMRGDDRQPRAMFSYVSAEEWVSPDHPLRAIRAFVDEILREMTREFDALYSQHGRRLLRAQLLQLFYSIRSKRLLMEQLDYNILFRWFVGLEMDEPIWVPTVFTKNRDRLLQHAVGQLTGAESAVASVQDVPAKRPWAVVRLRQAPLRGASCQPRPARPCRALRKSAGPTSGGNRVRTSVQDVHGSLSLAAFSSDESWRGIERLRRPGRDQGRCSRGDATPTFGPSIPSSSLDSDI